MLMMMMIIRGGRDSGGKMAEEKTSQRDDGESGILRSLAECGMKNRSKRVCMI